MVTNIKDTVFSYVSIIQNIPIALNMLEANAVAVSAVFISTKLAKVSVILLRCFCHRP